MRVKPILVSGPEIEFRVWRAVCFSLDKYSLKIEME